MSEQTLSLLNH